LEGIPISPASIAVNTATPELVSRFIVPLGQVVMTAALLDVSEDNFELSSFIHQSLQRHSRGDWGDIPGDDREENKRSLDPASPGRLLSSYNFPETLTHTARDKSFWIITEHDRSVTTLLLPSDY